MRLHDGLEYQARERGETDFAIFGDRKLSYAEANAQANQVATALIADDVASAHCAYVATLELLD